MKFLEHTEFYLKGVLGHIGLKDVTVIRAEGIGLGPDARQNAIELARRSVDQLGQVGLHAATPELIEPALTSLAGGAGAAVSSTHYTTKPPARIAAAGVARKPRHAGARPSSAKKETGALARA